jgi:hypothetical protein
MTDQPRQRELGGGLAAVLREQAGADRYQQAQRQARRGKAHARPLEFDESGFPTAQGNTSFVERVARLLNPK